MRLPWNLSILPNGWLFRCCSWFVLKALHPAWPYFGKRWGAHRRPNWWHPEGRHSLKMSCHPNWREPRESARGCWHPCRLSWESSQHPAQQNCMWTGYVHDVYRHCWLLTKTLQHYAKEQLYTAFSDDLKQYTGRLASVRDWVTCDTCDTRDTRAEAAIRDLDNDWWKQAEGCKNRFLGSVGKRWPLVLFFGFPRE